MGWEPQKEGDIAYTPVTDHPNFPKQFHVGESCLFREREVAEKVAAAWNSHGGEWKWYVKEVVLLPPIQKAKDESEDQLSFW